MIVLDVDDELGERLELETAAPEPAGVGEERGGGDARHVRGAGAFTGRRERKAEVAVVAGGDREPGPVCEEEEAGGRVFGSGVGSAAERAAAEQQTPGGQTAQRRTQLGGRRGGGGGWDGGRAGWLVAATSLAAYLLGRMVGRCHLINDLTLAAYLHVLSSQDRHVSKAETRTNKSEAAFYVIDFFF